MAKAAESTPPPFTTMEMRGHLRTAEPELKQQMLWLKVYTNKGKQFGVTVPTTTMTNTSSLVQHVDVTVPCTRLSYAFKSNVRLAGGNQSFQFPDSCLHLQTLQKLARSLFICLRLRRWFRGTSSDAPLQLFQEEPSSVKSLLV